MANGSKRVKARDVIVLIPDFSLANPNKIGQLMAAVGQRVITRVKQAYGTGKSFRHPTGRLINSLQYYVNGKFDVVIYSTVPYFSAVEDGTRPRQMWNLLGKTIPIKSYFFGEVNVTYRKVTLKALLAGKWRHPGSPGKKIVQQAINDVLASDIEEIARSIV